MFFLTPKFWRENNLLSRALLPASWGYEYISLWYGKRVKTQKVSVPVICVGNLVMGGAGKTPTVIALIDILKKEGHIPHILSRGYGAVVKDSIRVDPNKHNYLQVGDEALLLAEKATTWAGEDRVLSAKLAISHGATVIIMDDGLQNRHIAPQIRIGVFDGMIGIGNGMMLPAGPLRVPFDEGVMNLDAAVIIGDDQTGLRARLPADMPLFTAQLVPDWQQIDRAVRYVAVAGIGRPEKFFTMLRDAGVTLAETISFPDHHSYTKPDMTRLDDRARVHGATLITTEKDLVKMAALTMQPITTVPIRAVFDDPDGMRDFVLKSLSS